MRSPADIFVRLCIQSVRKHVHQLQAQDFVYLNNTVLFSIQLLELSVWRDSQSAVSFKTRGMCSVERVVPFWRQYFQTLQQELRRTRAPILVYVRNSADVHFQVNMYVFLFLCQSHETEFRGF